MTEKAEAQAAAAAAKDSELPTDPGIGDADTHMLEDTKAMHSPAEVSKTYQLVTSCIHVEDMIL